MEYHPAVEAKLKHSAEKTSGVVLPDSTPSRDAIRNPRPVVRKLESKEWSPKFLTREQVAAYNRDGFLKIPAKEAWTEAQLKTILDSVAAMDEWADAPGKYMKYYEHPVSKSDGKLLESEPKILSRIENFLQYTSPELSKLMTSGKFSGMVDDLFGEESILYKEKVNYKLPGGQGFKPHQDVAAGWWMYGQTVHISALITVDPATIENGCLEVVAGENDELHGERFKEIPTDKVERMRWKHVPTQPGDVLFFDSFVCHRSAPNHTDKPRRLLYSTYALKSEGDFRDKYYADKRKSFPPDCEREAGKDYAYKI